MKPLTQKQPTTSSETSIIEGKLVRMIRNGLAEAGIPTGNRRYGLIFIDSLKWPIGVSVSAYTRDVPIWRITFGLRERRQWPNLVNHQELTFHLSEMGTHTGVDLARLLCEPDWVWPLFEGQSSYPSYAWTKLASATCEAHRLKMQALKNRLVERQASR